jgi:FkbM family methyltransferase
MIELNTRQLFRTLLQPLRNDTVCDVGAMDGAEATAFRDRLPGARIVALEPNPENLRRMRADARLAAARIELVDAAAAMADGSAPFFVVPANYSGHDERRGQSSLLRRDFTSGELHEVRVRTARLDTLFRPQDVAGQRFALWIDAEGLAFEVLAGARDILPQVQLLHVELENRPCISLGQHLAPDAIGLLSDAGFDGIATDVHGNAPQFNAVFLRRGQPAAALRHVARAMAWGRARRRCGVLLSRTWPAAARRLHARLAMR